MSGVETCGERTVSKEKREEDKRSAKRTLSLKNPRSSELDCVSSHKPVMESLVPPASTSSSMARHFPPPISLAFSASLHRRRLLPYPRRGAAVYCLSSSPDGGGGRADDELESALRMDGTIPGSSGEFVRRVSSRAYDLRRHLEQSIDSSSYDVLESNPWREDSKPVYVLTQRENELCTMKTRRNRSEVERELGLLFSRSSKLKPEAGNKSKQSRAGTKFQMLVEDVREGVLVFEDEHDATKYCDLLQGGGQNCDGVAEVEASSVFDICHKMRALAVLFRRGRTPPLPESLKRNLRARKRSLEDQ